MSYTNYGWSIRYQGKHFGSFDDFASALKKAKEIARMKTYKYEYTTLMFQEHIVNELPVGWSTIDIVSSFDLGGGEWIRKRYTYKRSNLLK